MKKPVSVVFLFSLMLCLLPAAPYVGLSQGSVSTSLEVGYLTRSVDQNFSVSLPLLGALDSGDDWFRYPVASLNLLYKKKLGSTVALGFGPTLRLGLEYEKALYFQGGLLLQLSLEAPGVRDILFVEAAYLPENWMWKEGQSTSLLEDGIREYLRFGYRHAF